MEQVADGAAQAVDDEADEVEGEAPPCGAPVPEPPGGPTAAGAEKVPVTLYDRWRTAFHVDGVAFGKEVRQLREARGWTQRDLHDRTGVPIATLSELENGNSARPRITLSMTLAQAFGFEHPGAMLGVAQPPRPPGTHPAGPRSHPGEAEGPGPLTLDALVASLLKGVWAAQDGRPGPAASDVTVTPALGADAAPAAGALTALGGTPVFVGAVFLVAPKTLG